MVSNINHAYLDLSHIFIRGNVAKKTNEKNQNIKNLVIFSENKLDQERERKETKKDNCMG